MYSDYHVHSSFSFDSEETLDNIIKKAVSLNMKQIAITDHQDFNWPVKDESPYIDFNMYFDTLNRYADRYKNKIQILKGVELGITRDNVQLCRELLNNVNFDFVIGSCHVVDNMDPYYCSFWESHTDREAFELYFSTLLDALHGFNSIDTLGHLDYIVRYSPNKDANYCVFDYMDVIDEILKFIIAHYIKLEINTAGLAKGLDFPNPHTDIIKRYTELGGKYVTIGSDAHKACDIGSGFNKIEDIANRYNLKIYEK